MKLKWIAILALIAVWCLPTQAQQQNFPGGSGGGGTGSATNPAAPIMAFYFSNVCPTPNTGQCFFTASNTQIANDCTWSTSSTTVTCASSHFVAGDVGKRIMGFFKTDSFASTFGCVAGRITFASMTTGTMTIASFTSGTQIAVSANPSNAATGNNGCVVWGTPDDANAATFETAYAAVSAFCPKVMLAAAGYWFSSPHFSSQPVGCAALPSLVGQSTAYGNKVYTDGFELEGRGPGNTVIYLGDDFPVAGGNLCTNTEAGISGACFLVPVEGKWKDLQLSGGGQLACQVASGKVLLGVAVGTLENIQLTNFCQNASGAQIGIEADLLAQLYQVDNSGFGAVCFQNIATTGGEIFAYKLACENSPGTGSPSNAVDIRTTTPFFPTFTCNGCLLVGVISSPSGTNSARCAAGSECHFVNTVFNNCEAGSGCVTPGSLMLRVDGTAYLSDVTMTAQGGVTGVGSIGCATAGGKVFLEKTNLSNLSSQNYFDNGNCTLTDLGGNNNIFTGLGTTAANFIGSYVGDGHSLTFTCTGTANASATDSLYNTGPNVTSTTCPGQTTTIGTGIPFTQARTIWGINCTSSATTVSVACKVLVNGSTTNAPVCTMTAATHCIDFGHALAVNQGDLLSGEITTGAAETGANIKMQVIWGQ